MIKNIKIEENDQGQRLDKFLTKKLTNQSRSQVKKIIKNGLVLINNKTAKVHQFLKSGDEIKINEPKSKTTTHKKEKQTKIIEPKIIFENHDFLILEKPVGLLVHPTEKKETNTLVDWLLKKYPKIKNVGEQKYREGIIHRLDRDVSGIMIAAKTNKAFTYLKNQFKERKVKKEYFALVYGKIQENEGEINLPIGRNKEGQFVAHPRNGKEKFQDSDKIAKTKYKVVEYIKDYTLLKVQILTGRTHQIRIHLSAIGHPILGDQIYQPKKKFFHFLRRKIKVVNPGRIFLHSAKIGFYNLKDEWVEFDSPLPKKLKDFLNEQKSY